MKDRFRKTLTTLRRSVQRKSLRSPAWGQHDLSPVPWKRRVQLLEILSALFRQQGVEHYIYIGDSVACIGIREETLPSLIPVISTLEKTSARPFHVRLARGGKFGGARPVRHAKAADLASADALLLDVPWMQGSYQTGPAGGVEILFLEQRDRRLVAKHRRAFKTDWTDDFESPQQQAQHHGSPRKRHVLDAEPIDVVYTWVDSTDPAWRERFKSFSNGESSPLPSASIEERYIDREELRYSLRSLWLYAPFVRNIYIVTAGQKPDWLDTSPSNIHLVSHEDIFPDHACLPTFNSHAIEACLHRIPGLSEHFLYFNDDVFLGREVSREAFYTKAGLIKSRFAPSSFAADSRPGADAMPTDWASYNAVERVYQDFGIRFAHKLKHAPMPMSRSLLVEIEDRYSDLLETTRRARFRSPMDVSLASMFAHYYGIATRRAVEWENVPGEVVYADSGRADFPDRLQEIRRKNPAFFCLNVTRYNDIPLARQTALLSKFLEDRFPVPSPFESS